ncbi:murein transglycosylase A [Consotaella aegiceratis]|uniref:murein transglycosylase A n=1 Tax=Consotaella aegiceratis TaxID=3097961 RepID=UPI002F4284E9
MLSSLFRRCSYSDLGAWGGGDLRPALAAFRRSAPLLLDGRVKSGALGLEAAWLNAAAERALALAPDAGNDEARQFFEAEFRPARVKSSTDEDARSGFMTGYYEPEVDASRHRTERFRYPLYRQPADLVKVDDVSRPAGLDQSFRFARRRPDGLLDEYPDRAAIEAGLLQGRGLELAWLADPVEAFFIHIQGSARLILDDGGVMRVSYAAKTGHPFTAIGRILVDEGELTLAEADMAGIRRWLGDHPQRVRNLLNRNRSFIFFREAPVEDVTLGPVGAAKTPLTPFASIAVDRELHTFGLPFFIAAPELRVEGEAFARLMIAQDTGSAIVGPARADLFCGSGAAAGAIAGRIRHPADVFALVPAAQAQEVHP